MNPSSLPRVGKVAYPLHTPSPITGFSSKSQRKSEDLHVCPLLKQGHILIETPDFFFYIRKSFSNKPLVHLNPIS